MTVRVMVVAVLAVMIAVTFSIAVAAPGWDPVHLVGLAAIAFLASGLLSRGGRPR